MPHNTNESDSYSGLRFAVSTGSFIDFSDAKQMAVGTLIGRPHLKELDTTYPLLIG
ncbi:MAG: hypothetical protein M3Q44_02425 [bacterium]|nr:hypothetical protein [bacterium]